MNWYMKYANEALQSHRLSVMASQINGKSTVRSTVYWTENSKFSITGPLWGDATGERWNPLPKSQCVTLKASPCHDAIMINCHVTVKCIGLQPIAKFLGYTFGSGEFVSHWLEYWLAFVFEVMLFKAATFNSQAHKATFKVAPGNPTPWRRVPVTTIQKYFGWSDPI